MKHFAMKSLAVAALALAAAPSFAASKTNSMTNIVQVQGNCDIVAIGVDFGVVTTPIQAKSNVLTANVTAGNLLTGTTHAMKGHDGGTGANTDKSPTGTNADGTSVKTDDDILGLKGSLFTLPGVSAIVAPLNTLVSAALVLPGVYVSCASLPTSVTLRSQNNGRDNGADGANFILEGTGEATGGVRVDVNGADPTAITNAVTALATSSPAAASPTYKAFLNKITSATVVPATATANQQIAYELTFSPVALNLNLSTPGSDNPNPLPDIPATSNSLYLGLFPAAGALVANTAGVDEGDYADIAIATVNY